MSYRGKNGQRGADWPPNPLQLPGPGGHSLKSQGGPLQFRYNLALVLRPLRVYITFNTSRETQMNPFRKHDTPFLLTLLDSNRKALTHWMYADDVETTELNIKEITEVLTARGVTL